METAAARCSSQIPAGAEEAVLEARTLCSETLERPSCTEAKLVQGGRNTGGWQGSEQEGVQEIRGT